MVFDRISGNIRARVENLRSAGQTAMSQGARQGVANLLDGFARNNRMLLGR